MKIPDDLRYSSDHEWVRLEDGRVRVGITDYAQDALGDVVFVQVPDVGAVVSAGDSISEVESTKSVSDIYSPVAGTVVEVNPELGTEADYRKYKALGHGFRLGTGTSAEGCVVGAIRSGKTISNRRLTDVSSKTETSLQRRSDETIFERP